MRPSLALLFGTMAPGRRQWIAASVVAVAATVTAPFTGCGGDLCSGEFGLEFTREASGTEATLRGVVALWNDRAVAAGDAGTIVVRDEDGRWSVRASGTSSPLFAVAARGRTAEAPVTAVGAGGVIVFSGDAGRTWTPVDSGVEADLHGVTYSYGTVAVAVGDGVIVRSIDDGATWAPVVELDGVRLRAVGSVVENDESPGLTNSFLAVGDGGAAFLSRDDGATWDPIDVGTTADLHSVGITYGDTIGIRDRFWVVGANGTAREAKDALRMNWSALDFGTDADLLAISEDEVWLLAADDSLRALDRPQEAPFFPAEEAGPLGALLAVDAHDDDEAWSVGEGGTIVHVGRTDPLCIVRL